MKKFVLLFIWTILIIELSFFAVAQQSPCVRVEDVNGRNGDIISVPLVLENCDAFLNLGLEISYNNEALELTEVSESIKSGISFVQSESYSCVPYTLVWTGLKNQVYNGEIARLQFKIKDSTLPGNYNINVSYCKGTSSDTFTDGKNVNYKETYDGSFVFVPIGLTYKSGTVTVKGKNELIEINNVSESSFDVNIDSSNIHGDVVVGFYSSDQRLLDIQIHQCAQNIPVSFENTNSEVHSARVMWWDKATLVPQCSAVSVLIP